MAYNKQDCLMARRTGGPIQDSWAPFSYAVHNEGWVHFTESQADVVKAFGTLGLAARLEALERGHRQRLLF